MKKVKLLTALVALLSSNAWATYYYVNASTGNDSYTGTEEFFLSGSLGPWKTISKAASVAVAGDEIYVRAGNYGSENVVFANSGTAASPIKFIGYKSYAGDSPILVNTATATTTFNNADMPTLNGTNRNTGIAFNVRNRQYIIIKNFQIQNYEYGFLTGSSSGAGYLTVDNVCIKSIGDRTSSSGYSGLAFQLGSMGTLSSNNNAVSNCLVINSAAEAFGVYGNNNTVTGCKAFCNDNVSQGPTDYYLMVCGSYNTINSCYVYREPLLSAGAHGIGCKTTAEQTVDKGLSDALTIPATYNTFNNCTAVNLGEGFYVRHRKARYNTFYHCKAYGTYDGGSAGKEGYCIEIRDGASDNVFDGCTAENCNTAVMYEDTVEDGDTGSPSPGHPGNNNKIINCIFNNCYFGVRPKATLNGSTVADAGDNTLANNTFYKVKFIYSAGTRMQYIKNVGNIYYTGKFKEGTYVADIVLDNGNTYFKQCDFYNLTAITSSFYGGTTTNINNDPLFVSVATTPDLHLQSTSPAINKVDYITLAYNPKDFDNLNRYNGGKSEIGAYEYYAARPETTTGIEAGQQTDRVIVYPNPSNGIINLDSDLDATYTIYVVNIIGQPVYQGKYNAKLDLTHLNSGIYFLQILSSAGEKVSAQKISIE